MREAFLHRTWIDIDLDKLIRNYQMACSLTQAKVTCVVKSNAYGHGAVRIAQALEEQGCRSFAVSCAREGLELRKAGIGGEILVMGLTEPDVMERAVAEELTLTAACTDDLRYAEQAARCTGKTAVVQLKADTGFHRLGFACTQEAADELGNLLPELSHIRIAGLYSHLGLITEELDIAQNERLLLFEAMLAEAGVAVPEKHLCDSIGLVRYPQWHYDRVRVGAFLYGVRPSRSEHMPFTCEETLTLRTTVSQVRRVKAGEPIGYTDDMLPDRDVTIATLCAGFGDGYPRCLSNGRGQVQIRGQRANVFGIICMDQMMVDVTDIPGVQPGDEATLVGDAIPYQQVADWAHTNRNECITIMSRRPQRVYRQGGRIVTVVDDMLQERSDFE